MNRSSIIFIVLLLNLNCNSQSRKESEFTAFKSNFTIEPLPYNSSSLNKNSIFFKLSENSKRLNNDLCIRYLFNGDVSKSVYQYESFNMETGQSLGMKEDEFSFYPAFRIETNGFIFLGFLRITINTHEYFLAAYKNGDMNALDILKINKVNEELLPELFEFSFINENLNIDVFRYEQNPSYWKEMKSKNESEVNKTLISHKKYNFSKTQEKFKLLHTNTILSKCSVNDFQVSKDECVDEDPFYKLLKK